MVRQRDEVQDAKVVEIGIDRAPVRRDACRLRGWQFGLGEVCPQKAIRGPGQQGLRGQRIARAEVERAQGEVQVVFDAQRCLPVRRHFEVGLEGIDGDRPTGGNHGPQFGGHRGR